MLYDAKTIKTHSQELELERERSGEAETLK